jgi:hypothetical protein
MKNFLLLILSFVFTQTNFAQNIITETVLLDSFSQDLYGQSMVFDAITSGDDYIAVGVTDFPTGAPRQNMRLVKLDKDLNTIWDTTYFKGAIEVKTGRALTELPNKDLVIVGSLYNQPFAMCVNPNLDTVWTRSFFTPGGGWEAIETVDNDVIVGGWSEVGPAIQGVLQKWNASGELIWFENLPIGTRIYDLEIAENGEIIIGGSIGAMGYVSKHTSEGELIWSKNISLTKTETVYDVELLEDGKIVFSMSGSGFAGPIPAVGQLDSDGELLWTSGTDLGLGEGAAITVREEEIILGGSLIEIYGFSALGYLSSFDEEGMSIPESYIELEDNNQISSLLTDADNCVLATGMSGGGMYFRKSCLDISDNVEETNLSTLLKVFPQPTNNELNIEIENSFGLKRWQLFNAIGQAVLQGDFAQNNTQIQTKHLPKGIYWLQIELPSGELLTQAISIQ